MPRIIVVPYRGPHTDQKYLDEQVGGVHLEDEHSAVQILERLAWAISDAEEAERVTAPQA